MSKYAPVAPIALLEQLNRNGQFEDYHLLLPHEILKEPERYRELFYPNTSGKSDMFVILDNSVVELGAAVPLSMMFDAAEIVQPAVIVLPDVMGDAMNTVRASTAAANKWQRAGLGPFMAVVQGRSIPELIWCASQLSQIPNVEFWGAPRIVANEFGTRKVLDPILGMSIKPIDNQPKVHLLGMSHFYQDDIECASMPGVRGIDSANPLVLGQNGDLIDNYQHVPRGNYWEHTELDSISVYNINQVRNDIAELIAKRDRIPLI